MPERKRFFPVDAFPNIVHHHWPGYFFLVRDFLEHSIGLIFEALHLFPDLVHLHRQTGGFLLLISTWGIDIEDWEILPPIIEDSPYCYFFTTCCRRALHFFVLSATAFACVVPIYNCFFCPCVTPHCAQRIQSHFEQSSWWRAVNAAYNLAVLLLLQKQIYCKIDCPIDCQKKQPNFSISTISLKLKLKILTKTSFRILTWFNFITSTKHQQ